MNKSLAFLLSLSAIIALSIAVSNSYYVNLKGAEVDAERFLALANDWALFESFKYVIDAEFFIQFLGVFIYLFNFDEFSLTLIGLFAYYIIYIKLFTTIHSNQIYGLLAFQVIVFLTLFSPFVLLRVGALLREPYVILSIVFMVYFGSKSIETLNPKYFFYSLPFCFFGMFFHKALLAFLPVYFLILLLFSISINPRSILFLCFIFSVTFISVFVIFPSLVDLRGADALSVILTGDFSTAEKIMANKSGKEFRTTYDYGADFSNIFTIAITILKANFYYYFSPFPWKIYSFLDLYACIENLLRFYVVGFISFALVKKPNKQALFVLTCYIAQNTIWAVGTSNYGTGTRHHITTLPLLILAMILISNHGVISIYHIRLASLAKLKHLFFKGDSINQRSIVKDKTT